MRRHVISTYLGDALAEVEDVTAHRPDGGELLLLPEPLLNLDGLFVGHGNVDGQVLEGFAQRAPRALEWDKISFETCSCTKGRNVLHDLKPFKEYIPRYSSLTLTVTTRDLTDASTPAGMVTSWFVLITFIASAAEGTAKQICVSGKGRK